MEYEDLTRTIIEGEIGVHKELGPKFLESANEECLAYELTKVGFKVEQQKPVPVVYKEIKLECGCRLDILAENKVVMELKPVEEFNPVHGAQILTYPKFSQKKVGLSMNFNFLKMKDGVERYIN